MFQFHRLHYSTGMDRWWNPVIQYGSDRPPATESDSWCVLSNWMQACVAKPWKTRRPICWRRTCLAANIVSAGWQRAAQQWLEMLVTFTRLQCTWTTMILTAAHAVESESILLSRSCRWVVNGTDRASLVVSKLYFAASVFAAVHMLTTGIIIMYLVKVNWHNSN